MKNFIRTLAAAALLSGLVAGTAFAQDKDRVQVQPGPDGIITITESNQGDRLPNVKGKDILIVAGSPEFRNARMSELKNIADLHNDKLLIILVDPQLVGGVNELVASLVSGPVQYPTVLYIGPVLHNLVGRIPEGAITAMADRGLQGKAGMDTPQ